MIISRRPYLRIIQRLSAAACFIARAPRDLLGDFFSWSLASRARGGGDVFFQRLCGIAGSADLICTRLLLDDVAGALLRV